MTTKKARFENQKKVFTSYLTAILVAAFLALILRLFVIEAFRIPISFMVPSLLPGDHIFVNKLAYTYPWQKSSHTPARGDIIVFSFPNDVKKEFIKRVIAIPGDRIEIKNKLVILNSTPISKSLDAAGIEYQETLNQHEFKVVWDNQSKDNQSMMEILVPQDQLFVLGDNRSQGQDSRGWGFVPMRYITGKASLIWFSIGRNGEGALEVRWDRIFQRVN